MKISKIALLLAFLLVVPMITAWGPHAHNYIIDQIKEKGDYIDIVRDCLDGSINEAAFRAGSEIPDISVIYYYSEGGKNYRATHNWNFQQEVMSQASTKDEVCFAYGIAAHLIQDSISHTKALPEKIKETKVPNWLSHPLFEKKYDSQLVLEHPELMNETRMMLTAMFGTKGEKYRSMIKYALGENVDFDVDKEIDRFAIALDSFYETEFRPKDEISIFKFYASIDKLTNSIHPIVGKWNIQDINYYMDRNVELCLNTFTNWGARYQLSPHGFAELAKADREAESTLTFILILLLLISFVFPLYLIRKTGRIAKYGWLVFLVIPIILIAIIVIYALL